MIKQIRSKQAYILNDNIGVSYNTPIAANINGVTFITSRYYSNTTAHHKTDIIRAFNNSEVIEVHQEVIKDFHKYLTYGYYSSAQELGAAIIEEYNLKKEILKTLKNNQDNGPVINGQVIGVIKHDGEPTKKDYKNGNQDTAYKYKTTFKHITNISYEIVLKTIPKIIDKGHRGKFKTYDYKKRVQKIREC